MCMPGENEVNENVAFICLLFDMMFHRRLKLHSHISINLYKFKCSLLHYLTETDSTSEII